MLWYFLSTLAFFLGVFSFCFFFQFHFKVVVNEYFILLVALLCWDWSCATWSNSYAMVMLAVVRLLPIPHVDVVAACSPCCWWLDAFLLLLLLLELFFSFVSATRYKTGYDHILLGDLICLFFFVGLVFSFSSSLSSRSNTSLNFWSSFGCCFCCCCCCVIFLGIVGCHTEQMIFQYANIFAKPSLCFFVVDWSPSIKRRVARLSGYILPKWWVIESRGVI